MLFWQMPWPAWVEAYRKAAEKVPIKADDREIFPWRLLVSAVLDNLCHISGICIVLVIYIANRTLKILAQCEQLIFYIWYLCPTTDL